MIFYISEKIKDCKVILVNRLRGDHAPIYCTWDKKPKAFDPLKVFQFNKTKLKKNKTNNKTGKMINLSILCKG